MPIETTGITLVGALGNTVISGDESNVEAVDPESRLTDSGNSEYTRVTKADTNNLASRRNKVTVPGGSGYAVGFDGNGYVSLASGQTLVTPLNWSISLWVKKIIQIEDYSAAVFLDFGLGAAVPSGITIHSQKFQIVWNDFAKKTSNTVMITGNWYHCIVTSENNTIFKVYVNGTDETAGTGVGDGHAIGGNKFNLTYANQSGTFILDEVALFNKTLTPSEVLTYFNSGAGYPFNGTEDGIVNLWHLDEGSGTSVNDSIGLFNGNFAGTGNTWETGLIPIASTTSETTIWESKDGLVFGEKGIQTFGDSLGRTVINGDTIRLSLGNIEVASILTDTFGTAGFVKNDVNGNLTGGNAGRTSDHSLLSNLSYALAGHTGFETPTGSQTKVDTHAGLNSQIHGVGTSVIESIAGSQAKVDSHAGNEDTHHPKNHDHSLTGNNYLKPLQINMDSAYSASGDDVRIVSGNPLGTKPYFLNVHNLTGEVFVGIVKNLAVGTDIATIIGTDDNSTLGFIISNKEEATPRVILEKSIGLMLTDGLNQKILIDPTGFIEAQDDIISVAGDIVANNNTKGVVIASATKFWRIKVDDSGVLSTQEVL